MWKKGEGVVVFNNFFSTISNNLLKFNLKKLRWCSLFYSKNVCKSFKLTEHEINVMRYN